MSKVDEQVGGYLLTELQLMETAIHTAQQAGPSRLNFLLTIISAAYGGVIALAAIDGISIENLLIITLVISIFLLGISLITYEFLVFRSIALDRNARGTGRIRRYFIDKEPDLDRYISWQKDDQPTHWIVSNKSTIRMVVMILSSSIAGFAGALSNYLWSQSIPCASVMGVGISIILTVSLHLWTKSSLARAIRVAKNEICFIKSE